MNHNEILKKGDANQVMVCTSFDEQKNRNAAMRIATSKMDEAQKVMLKDELQKSVKVNHPNVIKILDVTETKDFMWVFTERYQFKNLKEFFEDKNTCLELQLKMLKQIVQGYQYLSSNHIIHDSADPTSILVDDTSCSFIKLQPFSFEQFLELEETIRLLRSRPVVAPPVPFECCRNFKLMYNMGMLFLAILQASDKETDFTPHINAKKQEPATISEILDGVAAFHRDSLAKQRLSKMIHTMTSEDPSFTEIATLLKKTEEVLAPIEFEFVYEPVSYKFINSFYSVLTLDNSIRPRSNVESPFCALAYICFTSAAELS